MRNFSGVVLAALSGVAACGAEAVSPPGSQAVAITFLRNDNPPYVKATDDAFADYVKKNPNVSVVDLTMDYRSVVSTMLAQLTRDQLTADLIFVPPSIVCSFEANLADVPEDIISLSEAQNTFFAAPLAGSTCKGKLKALPMEYNLEYGGVIVNLKKYQEKFPGKTPGWAGWASFIQEAAALSEYDDAGTPRASGLDLSPDWPQPAEEILYSQIVQRGGRYLTDDGQFNFDTREARESLAEIVKWITVDKVMFPSLVPDRNTFVLTRLTGGATGYGWNDLKSTLSVMGYAGTWALRAILSQLPPPQGNEDRFGFFTLPPMVGAEHKFVQNSGFAWAVPRTSKNQKVAWDMVKALALSPEAARRWAATGGSLPALRVNGTAAAAAGDPVLAQVQPLLERGQWRGYFPAAATDTIEATVMTNVFEAATGKKTVESALADMQQKANEAIKQSR